MIAAIIACEIGFWIAIGLGLLARYPMNMPKLGMAFFLATPLIDLALLAFVIIHLRGGATPEFTHGIAALYIGFSVAFGHKSIAAADRAYRKHVRKEAVEKPLITSPLRKEIENFVRAIVAAVVAVAVLEITIALANNPYAADLRAWYSTLGAILVIWALTGPVWALFAGNKKSAAHATPTA